MTMRATKRLSVDREKHSERESCRKEEKKKWYKVDIGSKRKSGE